MSESSSDPTAPKQEPQQPAQESQQPAAQEPQKQPILDPLKSRRR